MAEQQRWHTFLSHNSADKPCVEDLGQRLKLEGIDSWLDKWHLVPGAPFQSAIEDALESCETVCVFIGPSGLGPWQNEEMRAAIERRVSGRRLRVIPVVLPGGQRDERSKLPTFLVSTTWVEFRESLDEEEPFHRLKCGILGIEPGISPDAAQYEGQCPYRGLQAFQTEHAAFFFGREARIEWILDKLRSGFGTVDESRFLGILGASGSGKSSLVRAGLIPALKNGKLAGSENWPIIICRPGSDPVEALATALCTDERTGPVAGDVGDLIKRLTNEERRLHLIANMALHDSPASQRVLIIIDQFEEVFTVCEDDTNRRAFLDNLMYASCVTGGKTMVMPIIRADFYGKCAVHAGLAAALSEHQELVGPMTIAELREVIQRPAQMVGCEVALGLTAMLLHEMENQDGALPLLQHALREMWDRKTGRRIKVEDYQAIGELEGALERQADSVFAALNESERESCRRILLRLIQPGEGTEDTKRRIPVKQLGSTPTISTVVEKLAKARLISIEGDGENGIVEIAHEALIRSWTRLRDWIDKDRAALRMQHRLSEAAAEWDEGQIRDSLLFVGSRLADFEQWSNEAVENLTDTEKEFLRASVALRKKQRKEEARRLRRELATERQRERAEQDARNAAWAQKVMVCFAIFLILGMAALLGWLSVTENSSIVTDLELERLEHDASKGVVVIEDALNDLRQDVQVLSGSSEVRALLRARSETDNFPQESREALAASFVNFLNRKEDYVQARFIDNAGQEIVRVDRKNPGDPPEEVVASDLQNKRESEYFKRAIGLQANKVYISPVELNREHGQVAKPYVPVLRAAVPVFGTEADPQGIVIINQNVGPLFQKLRQVILDEPMSDSDQQEGLAEARQVYVTNGEGEFLVHSDEKLEYGFDKVPRYQEKTASEKAKFRIQGTFPKLSTVFDAAHQVDEQRTFAARNEELDLDAQFVRVPVADPLDEQRFVGIAVSAPRDRIVRRTRQFRQQLIRWDIALMVFGGVLGFFVSYLIRPKSPPIASEGLEDVESRESSISDIFKSDSSSAARSIRADS